MLALALLSLAAVQAQSPSDDWLLREQAFAATVSVSADGRELVLENGIARRGWRLDKNGACYALDDLSRDASLLRAVRPEARLTLDGQDFDVGGLDGQPNHAYLLPDWVDAMTPTEGSFRYAGWELRPIEERLAWKRVRHHAPDASWPPRGAGLRLKFLPPEDAGLDGLTVWVHYELYDGIPVFQKWLTLDNATGRDIELDRLTGEVLAVVEHTNWVETRGNVNFPQPRALHVETDYAFGGFSVENAQWQVVHWRPDPQFLTQVNYRRLNPCLLEVEPLRGPDVMIADGDSFVGFRVFELLQDSTERERRGLAVKRMYRTIAPWVTDNPLIMHVVSSDPDVVRAAIDQAAECGFEMVSRSFGSGLNMENDSTANHVKFRELGDYATEKGIHFGGYSLLASRRIEPQGDNAINPETGGIGGHTFGSAPALASDWGLDYFRKLRLFFEQTGFMQFTHDGSYPGDWDAAARPPLQRGVDDSQWVQWKIITGFYRWLRARGVYLRVPDYYFLQGSNEHGMGYRETNWSLPRAQQVLHARQNIYDGTWAKTPSMGWMFVPLTQYHGGGAAATIEPLDEHLDHYERMLASNLGMGVQAVYRGKRLYDTERVRDAVLRWVGWFKTHRDILESDMIHGRRADGRDLDWMLHVNPSLDSRGMLVVYNPLDRDITRTLRVPLYYTGLRDSATIESATHDAFDLPLDRRYRIELEVTVPAGGMSWYLIR
jgi:hypothetical protein